MSHPGNVPQRILYHTSSKNWTHNLIQKSALKTSEVPCKIKYFTAGSWRSLIVWLKLRLCYRRCVSGTEWRWWRGRSWCQIRGRVSTGTSSQPLIPGTLSKEVSTGVKVWRFRPRFKVPLFKLYSGSKHRNIKSLWLSLKLKLRYTFNMQVIRVNNHHER